MKLFALLGAMALALFALPAHAADVVIPWGDWLGSALTYLREIVLAAVSAAFLWIIRKLPSQVAEIITAMRLEQLLARATDYAIAAVAGAAKDKTMTVPVANQVIAEAVNYAVKSAPGLANKFADSLRAKILARLSDKAVLAPEVSAAATGAVVTQ